MSRLWAVAVLVALSATVLTAGSFGYAAAKQPDSSRPIKRAAGTLDGLDGLNVKFHTPGGAPFTLSALNMRMVLLREGVLGGSNDFKPGDKLVVYYTAPEQGAKVLLAAMDPPSEIVLAEVLRGKPVPAIFKSFDPATRKLVVEQAGRAKTYTMASDNPRAAMREGQRAKMGRADKPGHRGYAGGEKVLLVQTADGKQVRMVMDQASYDQFSQTLKRFPVPPAATIAGK